MKIELSFRATKLKNVEGGIGGTSDPFAVVTRIATKPDEKAQVIGKTEVINNTLHPEWVKVFVMDFNLGDTTKVAVNLFDHNKKSNNTGMGCAVFDIGEVLGARGNTKAKQLKAGGVLYAYVREHKEGSGLFRLKMKGVKLTNVEGMFSKSDPFFEISRKINAAGGQTWDNVYRSEDIHNNLNPQWKEAVVDLHILCGGDLDSPIKVSVFDHESSGKHIPMGEFESTVNALTELAKKQGSVKLKKKNKEAGTIVIVNAEATGGTSPAPATPATITQQMPAMSISTPKPSAVTSQSVGGATFIDYISGGCELNVAVAIDFTGSNGDPRKPGTLHHFNTNGVRNDYEKAIAAIVSILSKYDADQQYPVYGFGAKYDGVVRHCFECGGKPQHHGVSGVLDAYHKVFQSGLIMSGPTVFTEVIREAAASARNAQAAAQQTGRKQAYTVLLILTDGAVSDVNATAECLKQVADAPLSIVIVGVGNADFRAMQFLDDVASDGRTRDIAQFVEFNRFSHNSQALTSETLNEIPNQLTSYFKARGVAPLSRIIQSDDAIPVEEEEEIDLSLDVSNAEEEIVVLGGGDDFVDGFGAGR